MTMTRPSESTASRSHQFCREEEEGEEGEEEEREEKEGEKKMMKSLAFSMGLQYPINDPPLVDIDTFSRQ